MPKSTTVPLPGSERTLPRGAQLAGKPGRDEKVLVTLVLAPRNLAEERALVERLGSQLPRDRAYLSRTDFQERFGSTRNELSEIEDFALDNSMELVESSSPKRSVVVRGTVAEVSAAFKTELSHYRHPRGNFRGRQGPVSLPPDLVPLVRAVLGLDNRPQARAHFRVRPATARGLSYTSPQVATFYDYPSLNGSGQTMGIVELGGGYSPSDIASYFSGIGVPLPSVTSVSVDGATNSPTGDTNGPDAEVCLDIEVAGAVAPSSKILVYFAPNTDAGFVDAVNSAIHGSPASGVVSISWGSSESEWTSQGIQALNQAFMDAATLGVTVCAASGDNGSSDGVDDGLAHVDFPASSPYVMGCGGTRLDGSDGKISSQVVWDDLPSGGASGGGVSDVFPLPSWQDTAGVPPSANPGHKVGRGVPDVSGDADPQTGYKVLVDGQQMVVGGTSAVAPLIGSLLLLINQGTGKPVGYLNPIIYEARLGSAFRDIAIGNNGAYHAAPGWDPCTGWGSPYGERLMQFLG